LLATDRPVWVGSLIALLEPFGLSGGRVRTTLSRMSKRGWLRGERMGRHAYYSLTSKGRRLLEEGQAKIFHPTWDHDWDGQWVLLAYSIPQGARSLRDRLRDRLAWLGFGSIGNGLWISPHDVGDEVGALAEHMDLGDRLVWFRATRAGGETTGDLVARCWNLAALGASYTAFVARWAAVRDRARLDPRDPASASERAFVDRFALIHEFRRFRLEDPFLPRTLLPTPWPGDAASSLFLELHDALVGPADAHVESVLDAAP